MYFAGIRILGRIALLYNFAVEIQMFVTQAME